MIKTRVLVKAAMCVTFFTITVIGVGCENKPVADGGGGGTASFKGRKCPGGPPEKYEIEVVASSEVFKDPADADIVVCRGDKVSWFIQSPTGVIKIVFTDPNADELFGPGHSTLQSHAPNPKNETDEQTVKAPGYGVKIYKYNIVVEDPAGNKKGEKDPHIIPM
jgi:hypothetical protein